jgi:hypothetical protein
MRPTLVIEMAILSLALVPLAAAPAAAATRAQKMETCKFGADNDNLEGKMRDDFIKKCMANGNYEPAARKEAMKKTMTKKPVAKKPPAMAPATKPAEPPADKQ